MNKVEGKVFFFLALSENWETSERNILRDARIAREMGAKVIVYCYRDTVVDLWCQNYNLETYYAHGIVGNKISLYKTIKKIINFCKNKNVELIHCYKIEHLWPLAFFLRTDRVISLVFSLSHELQYFYRNIWHRPLIARIDHVFFTSQEMVDNITGHLGIPLRKIDYIGTGCSEKEESPKKPFSKERDAFYLATNVLGTERKANFIDIILNALKITIESGLISKKLYLVLASEKRWSHFIVANELRRKLTDMGLESHVIFVDSFSMGEVHKKIDLWIGQSRTEDIEDYCIEALLNRRPVIFPRTASSAEVIRQFGKVGETYKSEDGRELRHKILKVLENIESYQNALKKAIGKLSENFGPDTYNENLKHSYENLVARRERYLRKKS